ncbi:MAG: hypothetical protein J6K20_00405 [Thermoguttaceae bacterium]|nr:hypothetical protein [Thermoguttaceae bacterium]
MSKIKLLENTDDAGIFEQLLSGFQAATKDLKPGEKFHFVVERENDEATAARLDEIATEEANDAETVAEAKELAGKLRRGRKPKPASQLRRNKIFLRFTDSEYRDLLSVVDPERELAEAARELTLEAVRARLANAAE